MYDSRGRAASAPGVASRGVPAPRGRVRAARNGPRATNPSADEIRARRPAAAGRLEAMALPQQSYAHHTRWDPAYHFVAAPLALLALVGAVIHVVAAFSLAAVVLLLLAMAVAAAMGRLRMYATHLQDRVVRAEENMRHFTLTGAPLDPGLSLAQIIALRFAADAEFSGLCRRALAERLTGDQIKREIRSWRADHLRV